MPLSDDNFVSLTHATRPVKLADGKEHPITFRRLTHADWEAFRLENGSPFLEERKVSTSRLIAVSVVDVVDGKLVPSMTFERACMLSDRVAKNLLAAILEINGTMPAAAKKLAAAAKKKSPGATPGRISGSS